jgi:repressor LexA
MGITKKQKEVFDFISTYLHTHGYSPTQVEIKEHFGFKSLGSVQRYIQYLSNAGYLKNTWNSRRGLEPVLQNENNSSSQALEVPLLGKVAAGLPIESMEYNETVTIPPSMLAKSKDVFALRVEGESMIEDGIFDGDVIVVKKQEDASNGETVVATVDNEATVKRLYKKNGAVELHPANSSMEPFIYSEGNVNISGVVVGLIRTY